MAKQTFTSGQTLTAQQVNDLQTNDFNQTVSTKTAAYTFVVGDRGTRVALNDTTARTFTIDDAIFSAGDTIQVHNINTGVLTIAAGAGVTLNGADVLTLAQYQGGTIFFTSASSAIFFPTAKTVTSKVLQVVSTTKTDAFSTASTSYVDVTGLSVSITPTSASSTVLVLTGVAMSADGSSRMSVQLLRGATDIAISTGFATTNQTSVAFDNNFLSQYVSIAHMDSPATTSATTYKFQAKVAAGGGTGRINEQSGATAHGNVSTLTVMEIAP